MQTECSNQNQISFLIFFQIVDYADGTPNSAPQLAKDVVSFLTWAADRSLEDRKQLAFKSLPLLTLLTFGSWYFYRYLFKPVKTEKIQFIARSLKGQKK